MAPIVQAVDVSRRVGDVQLLQNVNLSIFPGDRIALVGAVGSGKTLLLRALAVLDQMDAGHVLWQGEPVRGSRVPPYRSRVMYLGQRPTIGEGTVVEELRRAMKLQSHRSKSFDRDFVTVLLDALGRDDGFLAKEHGELSGGELQIVALLRALQLDPQILLLDEPTASLDVKTTTAVEELITRWQKDAEKSRAMVWVSHDVSQAERVADRVHRMSGGKLEADR